MISGVHYVAETLVILTLIMITCGSLFVRFAFGSHKLKQDFSLTPTVTVMMSCFNEGASVYTTIKSVVDCDYPKDKLFVIAIDDCSRDNSWELMQKAAKDFPNVIVSKNPHNMGKPKSLLRALSMAKTELILNIDSDCGLHPDSIKELTSCFIDEKVGAVGGVVLVRNSHTNWLTQMQTLQYNTAFQVAKIGETHSGSVNCISGCLFMVRKAIYDDIVPDIEGRRFMGFEVKDGEDRFMTNLIISRGWKTLVNLRSKVYTDVPDKFRNFFSQQLRWRRGFVRMFIWSMAPSVILDKIKTLSFLAFVKHYTMCTMLLIMPMFVIWLHTSEGFTGFISLKINLMLIVFSIYGFGYACALASGDDVRIGPLAFAITPFWTAVDLFFLTVLAFATLTSVSWETRQ